MAKIGTILRGKYEILREIGRGGMSIVYLAMDTHLNKQWAVKEIRKNGSGSNDEIVINSLLAEANLMKRLDHASLPRIVDIIDNQSTIFVVMDYIEGESLDKILKEYGAQPEELVIGWAQQLCDALSYLHAQKPPIIYRDMKPANIMLKPEGNIKIIDFGIAREYKEKNLADTTILGTKGYAPPEQYYGQTDARSDLYALGMTLHHLLTGIDPRTGEGYAPVRMWNPELSEGIELIINKCVEPLAENRYQTCQELLYDLDHIELITGGYKRKQKRKLRIFIAASAAFLLCLISGLVCSNVSTAINNSDYGALISISTSSSLEEKLDSYKEAIRIYPERTEAYTKILEAYEAQIAVADKETSGESNKFGKEQNDEFLALYNANKETFDPADAAVAELNYYIGIMYFNYYTEKEGEERFAARVQKANAFFLENHDNKELEQGFEHQELSDCYYEICQFYKKYILNSTTFEEASKTDYEAIIDRIEEILDKDSFQSASSHDKLSMYNSVFLLLYDQRIEMAQVRVDQKRVLQLFDNVHNRADALTLTGSTDSEKYKANQKLKQTIVDNYAQYREAIEQRYTSTKEG